MRIMFLDQYMRVVMVTDSRGNIKNKDEIIIFYYSINTSSWLFFHLMTIYTDPWDPFSYRPQNYKHIILTV